MLSSLSTLWFLDTRAIVFSGRPSRLHCGVEFPTPLHLVFLSLLQDFGTEICILLHLFLYSFLGLSSLSPPFGEECWILLQLSFDYSMVVIPVTGTTCGFQGIIGCVLAIFGCVEDVACVGEQAYVGPNLDGLLDR